MNKIALSLILAASMTTFAVAEGLDDIVTINEEPVVEEASPTAPAANTAFYFGGAYGMATNAVDGLQLPGSTVNYELTTDHSALLLLSGVRIDDIFSVELRYWKGVGDATVDIDSSTTTALENEELNAWGIYMKPGYQVVPEVNVYALLGFAATTVDKTDFASVDLDKDGISLGVGASFSFTPGFAVFVDYTSLYNDEFAYPSDTYSDKSVGWTQDHSVDVFNFGVTYQF